MFGTRSFSYYGSKSRWLWLYFNMIPKKQYKVFLDACMGSGGIIATAQMLDVEKRIANEKDFNLYRLHKVLQNNYSGFVRELLKLEYNEKLFEEMKIRAETFYEGFSEEKAAAVEYCQIQFSFNNNRKNMRKKSEPFIERSQRNAICGLEDFSLALQGVEIRNRDCLEEIPKFIHERDAFIFQDSPYRPQLRKSPHAYTVDTDEAWHKKFLELLVQEHNHGGICSDMMICCYVDFEEETEDIGNDMEHIKRFCESMKNDAYCKALMPLGFSLLRIKRTVKPTVNKAKSENDDSENQSKKSPATECIFFNFELPDEAYDFVTRDDILAYNDVFECN